jgi:hypothetical protein
MFIVICIKVSSRPGDLAAGKVHDLPQPKLLGTPSNPEDKTESLQSIAGCSRRNLPILVYSAS